MLPANDYHDIELADARPSPRVIVNEGRGVAYSGAAGVFSPIHLDGVCVGTTEFGGRTARDLQGQVLQEAEYQSMVPRAPGRIEQDYAA